MRRARLAALAAALALITPCLFSAPISASEKDAARTKRPLQLQDILDWKNIRQAAISDDGQWFAYQLGPVEGDGQVVVRSLADQAKPQERRFAAGEIPSFGPGWHLAFSPDSRWLAFVTYPDSAAKKKAAKSKDKPKNKAVLIDLQGDDEVEFEKVKSVRFAGERGGWVAVHKVPGPDQGKGKSKWTGSALILRNLENGDEMHIGSVSQFAFNKSGELLAWTVDAAEKSGNGLQVRWMDSGVVRSLDNAKAVYKRLAWNEEGDALAALKGQDSDDHEKKLYSLLGFHDFSNQGFAKVAYDPHQDDSFPSDMTISPNRSPLWSEDRSGILFGIHDSEPKEEAEDKADGKDAAAGSDESGSMKPDKPAAKAASRKGKKNDRPKADLVVWHWRDKRMQSMQQKQASRDKNYSYLSVYRIPEKRFIRLADDDLRQVQPMPKQRWAVGIDPVPYQLMGNLHGRRFNDIYVVDIHSGERRLAVKQNRWYFGPSPDGRRFLYYDDGHFHVHEADSGQTYNVTRKAPVSFINVEDDHNVDRPPVRPRGWSADSNSVLLSDAWDLWRVDAKGGKQVNLTVDGRENAIRYGRRFRLDPEEKGIDLDRDQYFQAQGEWTKKRGIARLSKGKPGPKMLLWGDESQSRLLKAKNADAMVLTRAAFNRYGDFHLTGLDLRDTRRITDANPQQGQFKWSSGVRLIDYESDKGKKHQAALLLPADYEPGKRYPTVVYIYERLSHQLNLYQTPTAGGFSRPLYASNGYAILMPDISYTINDPGMSAVWCVLPALKAAIKDGAVDPDKVGLHGHSWGGYQTSFLITQSEAFAAAVAGAPLTNMISMYSSIYWNTGSANQPIFESSQGRFTGGYWEIPEAYARNSPVYFADRVETPLLLLHNDQDGAVDWNQGIEYFNTLRRLEKPVVMLQYKGENHGLRKPANRKDYTIRMKEFFDHHLKGSPAPEWLAQGVRHLELADHLDERSKLIEKRKKDSRKGKGKKGDDKKKSEAQVITGSGG